MKFIKKHKIILITSTMPGEGKTTIAVNLAQSLSRNGAKVILVDADLRKPSIKQALGVTKASAGLKDALSLKDPAAVTGMLLEQDPDSLWRMTRLRRIHVRWTHRRCAGYWIC